MSDYYEYDTYQKEVMDEILDECNAYAENCQRSEDEVLRRFLWKSSKIC